jgi:hypothetical protein
VPPIFMAAEEVVVTFTDQIFIPSMAERVWFVEGRITGAFPDHITLNNSLFIRKDNICMVEIMVHGEVQNDPARKTVSA